MDRGLLPYDDQGSGVSFPLNDACFLPVGHAPPFSFAAKTTDFGVSRFLLRVLSWLSLAFWSLLARFLGEGFPYYDGLASDPFLPIPFAAKPMKFPLVHFLAFAPSPVKRVFHTFFPFSAVFKNRYVFASY